MRQNYQEQGQQVIKRAVAYARFSSEMQREESIDAQLRAIKGFAKSNGYELISSFIDKAKSGMSDKRCEFQKMINLANTDKFDAVIVHKLDRFSRDRYDSINYKIKLRSNNIKVISVTGKIDDTPEGELLEGIIESVNQLYSKNLARETLKGLKENAYKAISTGGIAPLGYNFDDNKKLIINKKEAEAVRLIFHMYLENYSYPKIINKLNELGYKTKKNNSFGKNSLYEILRNEKYSGIFVYNKMEGKSSNGKRNSHKSKTESEIIRITGGCPSIIPTDIFNIAQDKLNSKARKNTNNNSSFYLSGKTFCELCNSNLYGLSKKNKTIKNYYHYYGCNNNTSNIVDKKCNNKLIRQEFIEDQIYDITISTLKCNYSRNNIINTLIDKLKVELNNQHTIKQELQSTESQINKLMELILIYNNPSLLEKLTMLECQKDILENKVFYFQQINISQFKNELIKKIKVLLNSDKTTILQKHIQRVVVGKDSIQVEVIIFDNYKFNIDFNR